MCRKEYLSTNVLNFIRFDSKQKRDTGEIRALKFVE